MNTLNLEVMIVKLYKEFYQDNKKLFFEDPKEYARQSFIYVLNNLHLYIYNKQNAYYKNNTPLFPAKHNYEK